jgi:hypothetical protein
LAGLSQCRAQSGEQQSADARARSHRYRPWYNVNLVLVANNYTELHARTGDAAVFLDERGRRINGQWTGSPRPVEHDIHTGSNADGTLAPGLTCADWTSDSTTVAAQWVYRMVGAEPEYCWHARVVERGAHESELLEHCTTRRSGPLLLLRSVIRRRGARVVAGLS